MFRWLLLLAVTMGLTLLIGGQDRGQQRYGLTGVYDPVPLPPRAPEPAEAAALVTPAAFTPAAPAPALAAPAALQMPLVAQEGPLFVLEPGEGGADAAPLPDDGAGALAYVTGQTLNVREGPSTGAAVAGQLERGESVQVLAADQDGWTLIRIEGDGIEGYVASRFLSDANPLQN